MTNIFLNILFLVLLMAFLAWVFSGCVASPKLVNEQPDAQIAGLVKTLGRIEEKITQQAGRDAKNTNFNIIGDNSWLTVGLVICGVPFVTYILPKLIWTGTSKLRRRDTK